MIRKKSENTFRIIIAFLLLGLILLVTDAFINKKTSSNGTISDLDKKALEELKLVYEVDCQNGDGKFWKNFMLSDHSVLLISKDSHYSYLINPEKEPRSIFASRLKLQKDNKLCKQKFNVYRISRLYPKLWPIKIFGGNFNTIGKTTNVMKSSVYYIKFDLGNLNKEYSSNHIVTFLYHEVFHYFMQNNWPGGERFTGNLDKDDMDLLEEKLNLLDQAKVLIKNKSRDQSELIKVGEKILSIEEKRKKLNSDYVEKENMMETVEGTATYMGIMASKAVGYDFGPMYFDNIKDVPFSDVVPTYKEGRLDQGFLRDRLPYETGAQITLLLDELDPEKNWQTYLNKQSKENHKTLLDALKEILK